MLRGKILNDEAHKKWQNCPRFGSLLEEDMQVPAVSIVGLNEISKSSV